MNKFFNKKMFDKLSLRKNKLKVFQNAYYWFIAPLAIIFIALVCGTVYSTEGNKYDGFANVGIDFRGGTVLTVEMIGAEMLNQNYDANEQMVRDIVKAAGAEVAAVQSSGTNSIIFRYPNSINGEDYNAKDKTQDMIAINNRIAEDVEKKFIEVYGAGINISADAELINATASGELINKAFLSVGLAMILILIYIVFRFDLFSGISAILALLHDILIMLACVIIFNIQINSSLIAGIITIVGYSINNTIIIFDRVRENVKPYKSKMQKLDVKSIIDDSVNSTLTRSFFTTLTTMITISVLAMVGVQALTEFALPIIFGLVAGFYSSVVIAPSIWGLMMQAKLKGGKKSKRAKPIRAYK